MSEYIIDVGEAYIRHGLERTLTIPVRINDNKDYWMDTRIPVTPYANPDLDQIRCEAYEEGRNSLIIEVQKAEKDTFKLENDEYYQRGINDIWGIMRKVTLPVEDGGFDAKEYREIFGYGIGFNALLKTFTASEVIAKVKAYEEKQKQIIKVGNEVTDDKGDIGVCTEISYPANSMHILYSDGTATDISMTGVTKTGNDFPEVIDLLKKMRGE